MIVGPESELRRIPAALDPKQAFFIEGIRVSIEMIDFAHTRLQATLAEMDAAIVSGQAAGREANTPPLLDAWSIIDSLHRLADLARNLPSVEDRMRIPAFRSLLQNSDSVNRLRNTVQHLPGSIRNLPVAPEWSVWGALSWCKVVDTDNIRCAAYLPGKAVPGARSPLVNPCGRKIRYPVGLITLSQHPVSVCISDLIEDVERFGAALEQMIGQSYADSPALNARLASDVTVVVHMRMSDEPPAV
jgi:hypothetical protein